MEHVLLITSYSITNCTRSKVNKIYLFSPSQKNVFLVKKVYFHCIKDLKADLVYMTFSPFD